MLNKSDLASMRREVQTYDKNRELLIKKSRDVLKLSKQVIYAVHRDELEKAEKLIQQIKKEKTALEKISSNNAFLLTEGSYKVALQEYAEAILYFSVINGKQLATQKQLAIPTPYYILGLCDLPGELVRKAVYLAGKDRDADVLKIRNLVDQIYGELLSFDFRDHETRRKFDSVKYDLKKLEDLALDLKLRRRR